MVQAERAQGTQPGTDQAVNFGPVALPQVMRTVVQGEGLALGDFAL